MEEVTARFDPRSLKRTNSRLTKHADLISVLSMPKAGSRSIQSARSIRTNRTRLERAKIEDLMHELSTDETKYMRELQTLVDGVIPVLLSCVLSKSDSAVAAGLFRASTTKSEDVNFTRPIVDMGVALERLKTLHKRIPREDPSAFLTWAHGAQRVYADYLKAWRTGFQDVVVNLAPAVGRPPVEAQENQEEGLPRDIHGDVINGDGEKVDVAFLLKRPLVRVKYLAKTLKGVNIVKPSAEAASLAVRYQGLVESARQRANEERARLEDESAANIDATRSRDPRTLAPLSGVIIDRTRRVRARDHFNLALQHSSGQCIDCRVELVLRDEASTAEHGGDLLICEVDTSGRWLLFPPISSTLISARNGDFKGEILVMVRGFSSNGSEWQEVLTLRNEEEQAGFEWVQMLGLEPVPPTIARSQSFVCRKQRKQFTSDDASPNVTIPGKVKTSFKSRTPSPREVDVPIGEQASEVSKRWSSPGESSDKLYLQLQGNSETCVGEDNRNDTRIKPTTNYIHQVSDLRSLSSQSRENNPPLLEPSSSSPRNFEEALGLGGTSARARLRRTKAKRVSKQLKGLPGSPVSRGPHNNSGVHPSSAESCESDDTSRWQPLSNNSEIKAPPAPPDAGSAKLPIESKSRKDREGQSPINHEAPGPSANFPYIPKTRTIYPVMAPAQGQQKDIFGPRPADTPVASDPTRVVRKQDSPNRLHRKEPRTSPVTSERESLIQAGLDLTQILVLTQTGSNRRRSSSPLKHEYEPSTASGSSSDSEASTVEHREVSSVTDSSDDEGIENGDIPTPLVAQPALGKTSKALHKPTTNPTPERTLKPSDSASQAPYKTVPSQPNKSTKTIASIFAWSDTGSWQSLHPDECSITVTPGLIEAFEMSAAHSHSKPLSASIPIEDPGKFADSASSITSRDEEVLGERPLVALELTPLVPLRRGTAIDISIRSPPTGNSRITTGSNIMFRSRNPEECEALYALINHSRIHNPTYIALQNARGPFAAGCSYPGTGGQRPSSRSTHSRQSWFGGIGRSSSYRASSARTPSIAPSDSSVGSMSSAFSALRRFGRGAGGGMFNIGLSTITSRSGAGSAADSVYTSSDNSCGSGAVTPIAPGMVANRDGSLGLKDAKIRLYIRETASR